MKNSYLRIGVLGWVSFAVTGVNVTSIGALSHSVMNFDIGLDA